MAKPNYQFYQLEDGTKIAGYVNTLGDFVDVPYQEALDAMRPANKPKSASETFEGLKTRARQLREEYTSKYQLPDIPGYDYEKSVIRQAERMGVSPEYLRSLQEMEDKSAKYEAGKQRLAELAALQEVEKKAMDYQKYGPAYKTYQQQAEEMGFAPAANIFLGRELSKLGAGTKDLALSLTGMTGQLFGSEGMQDWAAEGQRALAKQQAMEDKTMGPLMEASGPAEIVGGMIPYVFSGAMAAPRIGTVGTKALNLVSAPVRTTTSLPMKAFETAVEKGVQKGIPGAQRVMKETVEPRRLARAKSEARQPFVDPHREHDVRDVLGGTGLGAIEGAMHYDLTPAQGAISGAFGGVLGKAIRPQLSRHPNLHAEDNKRILDWYETQGATLLPGARLNSKPMQMFESALESDPTPYSDIMSRFKTNNRMIDNQIAFEAMGIPRGQVNQMNPERWTQHINNLRNEFDSLVQASKVDFTRNEFGELTRLSNRLMNKAVTPGLSGMKNKAAKEYSDKVVPFIDELRVLGGETPQGIRPRTITGAEYQDITERLNASIKDAYDNNKPEIGRELLGLKKMLDRGLDRGIQATDPKLAARWDEVRRKWSNTQMIKDYGMTATGDLDINKLSSYFKSSDMENMLKETGGPKQNLYKLVKKQEIMNDMAKAGLKSDTLGHETSNFAKVGTFHNLLTGGLGRALSPLANLYLKMYAAGWSPAELGYLGLSGKELGDVTNYIRALEQEGQYHSQLIDKTTGLVKRLEDVPQNLMNFANTTAEKIF